MNNKGFLLLEVMVSVVIVTGGLLYVTRVYSTANEIVKRSRAMFEYGLLMEETMFGYEEKGEIRESTIEGSFEDPKDVFWKISPTHLPRELRLEIDEVAVEVYERKGSKVSESRSLTTYLKDKK